MNSPEHARQRGVFISQSGEFHKHPQIGDHEIRPKRKKIPKPKGPKPFDEVVAYVKDLHQREEGMGARNEETLDGGVRIIQDGVVSPVGEVENDGRPVKVEGPPVPVKRFSSLSEKAQKLYYGLHRNGKI